MFNFGFWIGERLLTLRSRRMGRGDLKGLNVRM
jgi:hypothetical protein